MSQKSPQDLFPNLFGVKAQKRPAPEMKPQDMRLLQYCMRQAAKRPAAAVAPTFPAPRQPRAMGARPTR